jgi:hypothetical protein
MPVRPCAQILYPTTSGGAALKVSPGALAYDGSLADIKNSPFFSIEVIDSTNTEILSPLRHNAFHVGCVLIAIYPRADEWMWSFALFCN